MVLNPTLYSALKLKFGEVKISNQGEKGQKQYFTTFDGKKRVRFFGGEHYRVNCPLCGDKRFRLHIHYAFGTYDSIINQKILFCAHCFNCGAKPGDGKLLKFLNFSYHGFHPFAPQVRQDRLKKPVLEPEAAKLPGIFLPLVEFSDKHPIIEYVKSRNFDPEELWNEFGIGVCLSKNPLINRRLLIPIFWILDNKLSLIGWQARAVPGFSDRSEPKYFTMAGFKKSIVLFNFFKALRNKYLVITEGAFDAIRIGPAGVALFGKTISQAQVNLLYKYARNIDWVIMLDKEAQAEALAIKKRLTTTQTFSKSRNNRVIVVEPTKDDPGMSDRSELINKIESALGQIK